MSDIKKSKEFFERARMVIPGGVNSPVRACNSVGCDPLFIERASGSKIWTVDGIELIDYVMSWGPMLLGYNAPGVIEAVKEAADRGTSFGAPCPLEVELAEEIRSAMPSMEMVRMVNSGTEATMSALRLARGYTGRDKIIKFEGGYHGHSDCFLASAGSGLATLSIPGTPGVPEDIVRHTLLAPYNNLEAVKALFDEYGENIAGIIVEPVAGNMGLVPPVRGFLQGLRDLCTEYGALLIFDEVITGFRIERGGAQSRYHITPDLTCLGKIIGGGLPVGAYGGRRDVMEHIAPCGDVYQAGTLSGNPLAMAAGLATLRELAQCHYGVLEERTIKFSRELKKVLEDKGVPVMLNQEASAFTLFFCEDPVTDFESAKKTDTDLYAKYYAGMRENGVNLAPAGFECTFLSFAHSPEDLEKTLEAASKVVF